MNKSTFLRASVFMFLLFAGVLSAFGVQAQSSKVSLSFRNAEIKTVLNSIRSQTGYDFVYNADEIDNSRRISVNVKDADLKTALGECFDSSDIGYAVKDNMIILKRQNEKSVQQQSTATQQRKTLRGRVSDESGVAILGVSVRVVNTQFGTLTNSNGNFSLSVPDDNKFTLVFSFVGMKTQTVEVSNPDREIRVVLKEDAAMLSEVVATGMQVIKRDQMTGSA